MSIQTQLQRANLQQYLSHEFPIQAVALSNVVGMQNTRVLGVNPSIGVAVHVNMWHPGGRYPYRQCHIRCRW